MLGTTLVYWTARLAVVCYAARLFCEADGIRRASLRPLARTFWTCGCGFLVLHTIAAFHYVHGWSHTAAFNATAQRTAEMTDWNSGIGLYINEAFLALWAIDSAFWWRDLSWPDNRIAFWTVQGVFAFLIIQATVVFGAPFWKPLAAIVAVALAIYGFRTRNICSQRL